MNVKPTTCGWYFWPNRPLLTTLPDIVTTGGWLLTSAVPFPCFISSSRSSISPLYRTESSSPPFSSWFHSFPTHHIFFLILPISKHNSRYLLCTYNLLFHMFRVLWPHSRGYYLCCSGFWGHFDFGHFFSLEPRSFSTELNHIVRCIHTSFTKLVVVLCRSCSGVLGPWAKCAQHCIA